MTRLRSIETASGVKVTRARAPSHFQNRRGLILLCAMPILWPGLVPKVSAQVSGPATLTGKIVGTDLWNSNTITVQRKSNIASVRIICSRQTCYPELSKARINDLLTATVDRGAKEISIVSVQSIGRPVGVWPRIIAFGVSLLLLLLAAALATKWLPWKLMIGSDNRYSNSQCQIVLWFGAVATMYLGTLILRVHYLGWGYLGGIGITTNVAAITGLSALSFGGAKTITMAKIQRAEQAGLSLVKSHANEPRLRTDLFMNDKEIPDFGDFQMIVITVLAVGIFVAECFHGGGLLPLKDTVTLPDVDSSLLAGFGIGHGAYLAKKAALKLGDG